MFKAAFSGFSASDIEKTKAFYQDTLGLEVKDGPGGALQLRLPNSESEVFIYPKEDHQPATFTILNFVVEDIDKAVEELTAKGITFEQYHRDDLPQDEKGVARGKAANMGPDIAWFKDPDGNILSILTN